MDEPRILCYTVTRADTSERVKAATASLLLGQKIAGISADWIIYANSPQMHEWASWAWRNGQLWNDGINKGQHVALRAVLDYARCDNPERHGMMGAHTCQPRYDFIVKVDDDVEWISKRWLRKLVVAAQSVKKYSGRWCVVGPRVFGLINPIPHMLEFEVPSAADPGKSLPLRSVPIIGGLVRLHHLSFFDGYEPDVRLAMGAGGDTTIMQHAEATKVGMIVCSHVRVRHRTRKQQEEDAEYHEMHPMFQVMPYIPTYAAVEKS